MKAKQRIKNTFNRFFPKSYKKRFIRKNKQMLVKNGVYFYWWSEIDNFGDYINNEIYHWFFNKIEDNDNPQTNNIVFGVGSVIQVAEFNSTIWGSGLIKENAYDDFDNKRIKLDIRLVRGPLTRKRLMELGYTVPEKYGDPSIVLPLIYNPDRPKELNDYVIIAHYKDYQALKDKYSNVINAGTTDYKSIVNAIVSSKKVISTSLHGIILSEIYGVPAVLLHLNESLDLFKYRDYYLSTNREDISIAYSVEEALEMPGNPLPKNIKELQDNIISTFPYDLLEKK